MPRSCSRYEREAQPGAPKATCDRPFNNLSEHLLDGQRAHDAIRAAIRAVADMDDVTSVDDDEPDSVTPSENECTGCA